MKIIKAIYFIWVFANCYCMIDGISSRGGNVFTYKEHRYVDSEGELDFDGGSSRKVSYTVFASQNFEIPFSDNRDYDLTEFFVYVGTPALLYFLICFVRK